MQQTPAEQQTQLVEAPSRQRAQTADTHGVMAAPQRAEPFAIYDYAQIKNAASSRPPVVDALVAATDGAAATLARGTLPAHIQNEILAQLGRPTPPPPPLYDPRAVSPATTTAHRSLSAERARLQPQAKGETPSHSPRRSPRRSESSPDTQSEQLASTTVSRVAS